MKLKNRNISIDIIRISAIILVIVLHTIILATNKSNLFVLRLDYFLEPFKAFSRVSVPIFFMISGFLLLGKKQSTKLNFKRIYKRLLIPFVFFTLLNSVYSLIFIHNMDYYKSILNQFVKISEYLGSHLWFLLVLSFLYLFNPFLQQIFSNYDKNRSYKKIKWITAIAFLYTLLTGVIIYPLNQKFGLSFNNFTIWPSYLFFYLYGGLLRKEVLVIKNLKVSALIIIIGLLSIISFDYISISFKLRGIDFLFSDYSVNYLSIPVILTSIGFINFILSYQFNFNKSKKEIIKIISNYTFGVYLVHIYLLEIINIVFIKQGIAHSINIYFKTIIYLILTIFLSYLLVYIIKRNKLTRLIIGG